ncbi:hypothetical protein [Macrococcus bovicus]|uniref:Uncharacterized protein n=1 Tax=Macrococcus bovicus TaxID=69968 RepID=A0A4V3BFT8_9STAP|nr:hypothetical protein [Macrococcus bovicus]TDM15719.1 hypothetical protein ERX55_02090 [Macrococcus bovicus]
MPEVKPNDALILMGYGFKQNPMDPKRFNKHIKNGRLVVQFNEREGWSGRAFNRSLAVTTEITCNTMQPILDELKKEEGRLKDETYAAQASYGPLRRIEK